jgi:hypothetical protein
MAPLFLQPLRKSYILRLKDCQIGIHNLRIIRETFERASTNHKKSSSALILLGCDEGGFRFSYRLAYPPHFVLI